MENLITRYRNVSILVAVLFVQVLGLAIQVKRNGENEPSRLIRVWAISAVTPLEKAIVWCQGGTSNWWHQYVYLRGVREENRHLKAEIERLRLEQVRLTDDAEQARRLQALLGFKEQYISKTIAAQVIGSSGSEQSRSIFIDKGDNNGIRQDLPVITADGVVGKVLRVFNSTSQILLINDQSSGVGVILEKSRLQGVLRGTPAGEVILEKVMADEQVQPGEKVMTSGGDLIFPKGLPVGTVTKVSPGADLFLNIRVRPSTNLGKLEEVLVITTKEERPPSVAETGPVRAADILAQRLPSVPDKAADGSKGGSNSGAGTAPPAPTARKPDSAAMGDPKSQPAGSTPGRKEKTNSNPGDDNSKPTPAGRQAPNPRTGTPADSDDAKPAAPKTKQPQAQPSAEPAPAEDRPQ